jgi:hypothetical protein
VDHVARLGSVLRFASLPNAADPLMLIWGDRRALEGLAALLRHGRGVVVLIDTLGPVQIAIEISDLGGGMAQLSGSDFRWSIRRDDCERFADLVNVVASSATPCHHYLDDVEGRGLTIKVSNGEYLDDFRP